MGRTFFLDQHGCAKNQVDGELLIARLEAKGLASVEDPADADLIIVNSCGFIESAKSEAIAAGFSERYPGVKVYRKHESPYFKVTVGDFRTRADAQRFAVHKKNGQKQAEHDDDDADSVDAFMR